MIVEKKIGKTFLRLIDKHFPRTKKFKTFQFPKIRSNVKVSYSCLSSFARITESRKKKILSQSIFHGNPKGDGPQKYICPLKGNYLDKKLVCQRNLIENITSDGVSFNGLIENKRINIAITSSLRVRRISKNYKSIFRTGQ